jgi:hypothetical protein
MGRVDDMVLPYIELVCGELLYSMLGSVTPTLRAVSFACKTDHEITLRFFVTGTSGCEREIAQDIVAEFEAYHVGSIDVAYDVAVSREPIDSLDHLEHLVYARYEPKAER